MEDGIPVDTSPITQGLSDPATVTVDGQTVTAKPLADLIAGIQFQAAANAVVQKHRGLRFNRIIAPPQMDGHRGGGDGNPGSWS